MSVIECMCIFIDLDVRILESERGLMEKFGVLILELNEFNEIVNIILD